MIVFSFLLQSSILRETFLCVVINVLKSVKSDGAAFLME